jgi:hypothetical protein
MITEVETVAIMMRSSNDSLTWDKEFYVFSSENVIKGEHHFNKVTLSGYIEN